MNHVAIINPKSGNFFQRRKTKKIVKKIQEGLKAKIHYSKSKEDAQKTAINAYQKGVRSFFIFGGDGTIFDIVNALYPKAFADPPTFALFPTGTGNSMVKDFSDSPEVTLGCIFENQKKDCDVLELTSEENTVFFTNLASFGFVAKVAKVRNEFFHWMGPLGYVFAVLCTLPFFRAAKYPLIVDGDRIEHPWTFISCNNTRCTGGDMLIAPHALADDGRIALVLVQGQSKFKLLKAFPKIFSGTHVDLGFVTIDQSTHIEFESPQKQPIMIDGELIIQTPKSLKVHHHALKVYAA